MIDSSGRRILRANGTVFDLLPVGWAVGGVGALLVLLFTLMRPEASQGLCPAARSLFWALHVGAGLLALWVASRALASRSLVLGGAFAAVLVTGLAGIAIAVPAYLLLDALYAPHVVDADLGPVTPSWAAALAKETLEVGPWFLATWFLVNLPALLPRPDLPLPLDDAVAQVPPAALSDASAAPERGERFLATLPGVIGRDVIAVASDLHYLNVWTVAGRTTVLGNLRDVVAELGGTGMQVHRSHWIAHAHVRRVVGSSAEAACILSNELRVPVSRRRWKSVREQYGRGVVHRNASTAEEAGPEPD